MVKFVHCLKIFKNIFLMSSLVKKKKKKFSLKISKRKYRFQHFVFRNEAGDALHCDDSRPIEYRTV